MPENILEIIRKIQGDMNNYLPTPVRLENSKRIKELTEYVNNLTNLKEVKNSEVDDKK